MPEKSLTIAAYAAGASLAAATLVYVFGPTIFLDGIDAGQSDRKRVAVGLRNDANDCFINSVLQALTGLPTLRLYLIHEIHLREVSGIDIYQDLGQTEGDHEKSRIEDERPDWLRLSLQNGTLTAALKEILDALNERPLSRKTITAQRFISAVEVAFKTRVSRYQQDAQEFLQLIMERIADEHKAGVKARRRAGLRSITDDDAKGIEAAEPDPTSEEPSQSLNDAANDHHVNDMSQSLAALQDMRLPFEGKISSQIECMTCHFKPKPTDTTFVTLTLNVPHNLSSTSLDKCLDGILKVEHIDDFKCDRCRLVHAVEILQRQLVRTGLWDADRTRLEMENARIEAAIEQDPEHPPKDLMLPDAAAAPKRRIARHMRISLFPNVLGIHLSRSVWDGYSTSSKNTAKVSFPERLQLGSLLDRKTYKLMSVVTHKGGHNSGHYETFRRQWLALTFDTEDKPIGADPGAIELARLSISDEPLATNDDIETRLGSLKSSTRTAAMSSPMLKATSQAKLASRKKKAQDRWWRISDEKVKECKSTDVLAMQKEIYLLFYELIP